MSDRVTAILVAVLVAVAAYVVFSFVYVRLLITPKPHGVILITAPGLTPDLLSAARAYQGVPTDTLAIDQLPRVAIARVFSAQRRSAHLRSALAAIASGHIADADAAAPQETLVDLARRAGRATGLVTTGPLFDPDTSGFFAVRPIQSAQDVASAILGNVPFNVALGGGHPDPALASLSASIPEKGFDLITNALELVEFPTWRLRNAIGLFGTNGLPFFADQLTPTNRSTPTLDTLVTQAISLLEKNVGGYFLIIHTDHIAQAARLQDSKRAILEAIQLDAALRTAAAYAGPNALIVVTPAVNLGGGWLLARPSPPSEAKGPAPLPLFVWPQSPLAPPNQPAWTGADVWVGASGPGSDAVTGFFDAAALFTILSSQL